jgi:hypothetical protein
MSNESNSLTSDNVLHFVQSNLLTTRQYDFYFSVNDRKKLPSYYKVGYCDPIEFVDIPQPIRNELQFMWNLEAKKQDGEDLDQSIIKRNESSLFLNVMVEANGIEKAKEIAIEKIESSMDVLRLEEHYFYHWNRYDIYIKETGKHFPYHPDYEPFRLKEGQEILTEDEAESQYEAEIGVGFDDMSVIITEDWPKSAEDVGIRLKNVIRLRSLAIGEDNFSIRLVLLNSALESMLLTDSDKDSLALKLAEPTCMVSIPFQLVYKSWLQRYDQTTGLGQTRKIGVALVELKAKL